MNLTIKTSDLKTALQPYKKLSQKITNFILSGVKLTADQDSQTLTIEGTDLELSLKTVVKAEVTSSGEVVVPYKNLDNLANVCKEKNINLELLENKKMVKSSKHPEITKTDEQGNEYQAIDYDTNIETEEEIIDYTLQAYKLKLNCFDLEEFPLFPELKSEGLKISNSLNFNDFKLSISKVIDFASKDQSRVILTGLLLDTKNNVMVATDSYKLATQSFDFGKNLEIQPEEPKEGQERIEPQKIILPSRVYELLKLIKADNFDIKIDKDNQSIEFTIDNLTIVSRLLQGRFPDYEKLIPEEQNFNYCFKINAKKTIEILDEASKLLNLNSKDPIPIKITVENNNFKFSAKVREVGDYESTLKIENLKESPKETFFLVLDKEGDEVKKFETNQDAEDFCGKIGTSDELYPLKVIEKEIELSEPLQFVLNPDYFKICLKNLIEPILSIVEPLKPMVLQETDDFKVLLMPIRVS